MKKLLIPALFLAPLVAFAASTFTTNYDLEKPQDGSTSWGPALRDNFDTIDAQMGINAASLANHLADAVDAHDSTAISSPGGTYCSAATTVEAFLDCLDAGLVTLDGSGFTAGSVAFFNGTGIAQDNAHFFWDDTNNRLGLGTTAPAGAIHISAAGANEGVWNDNYGQAPFLAFRRPNGTAGSPTRTASGNIMGSISARGYQETTGAFSTGPRARITFNAAENFTSTAQGANMVFATTPVGSTTITTALTLGADQSATFANTATATSFVGALTGNASTSSALAANPADCASNTYATTIAASGDLTCASITNASTTAASANTASAIVARDGSGNFSAGTITATLTGNVTGAVTGNASTATALAANPADCASDTYANAINASGTLTCATVTNAGLAGSITRAKLASGTAYRLWANDVSGVPAENAALTATGIPYADTNGQLATSAVGSGAGLFFDSTNSYVGIGQATPSASVHVAKTTALGSGMRVDGYGQSPYVALYGLGGTPASPTKTTSGMTIGSFSARGYQETTSAFSTGPRARILMAAAEDFTSTAQGTTMTLSTTPTGSTTLTTAVTLGSNQSATFAGLAIPAAGVKGVSTNTNATAGNVGEYVESVISSPASLPGATTAWGDGTSISLTAGDWDVTAVASFILNGSTCTNAGQLGISTTSGNSASGLIDGSNWAWSPSCPTAANRTGSVPSYRLSLSGTTTVYLKLLMTYSAGTPQFQGRLSARRVQPGT